MAGVDVREYYDKLEDEELTSCHLEIAASDRIMHAFSCPAGPRNLRMNLIRTCFIVMSRL